MSDQAELIFDTSDARAVKTRIKAAQSKADLLRDALTGIMTNSQGRMWMKSLLAKCDPLRSPFNRDPIQMAFTCGEANIGLQLIAELHACSPDLYLQMMKENPND